MRTVIVCNIKSLDGYYEGPGQNVIAMNMDQAFDAYNLDRIRRAYHAGKGHGRGAAKRMDVEG